jgi:hypothetical protein
VTPPLLTSYLRYLALLSGLLEVVND